MTTKRQHDKAGSPRTARGSETGSGTGSDTAARSAAVEHLRSLRALLVALPPAVTEAEAVDRLRALEELKASCAAAQAREADRFAALRREAEAERGVPARERGRGVAAEVALARRESPHRGSRHLGLATALVREMPHTLTALSEGRISEEHATAVCRETAWLAVEHRRDVDTLIAPRLGEVGPQRLGREARGHAQRLDQDSAVAQRERCLAERRVSVRPAPGGMAYLTALLPLPQAVSCYAALTRDAATAVGTGDAGGPHGSARTRDQVAADLLVERTTGQATAAAVPVELHLVMGDRSLLDGGTAPAWIPGHGPLPADAARELIDSTEAEVFVRRLYTDPGPGQLVAMESTARIFPPLLRRMVVFRDDTCRTPWCDAPIRHLDHATPHREGGPTSWDNASGLCARCNQTKENPGWAHRPEADGLEVTTPTGHRHRVQSPALLRGSPPTAPPETPGRSIEPEAESPAPPGLLPFDDFGVHFTMPGPLSPRTFYAGRHAA